MNYVIYRTLDGSNLDFVQAKLWDDWVRESPNGGMREVSRVETMAEAINLTMLANSEEGESK